MLLEPVGVFLSSRLVYLLRHRRTLHYRTFDYMHQVTRHLLQEARRCVILRAAVDSACSGVAQEQMLFRTRNAYVAQAALLFNLVFVHQSTGMRENSFLHTYQKDIGEFQALGGMQRHQSNCFLTQLRIINIGNQRYISQEVFQRRLFTVALAFYCKFLGYAQHFLQVLHTAFVLRVLAVLQLLQITCFQQHIIQKLFYRHIGSLAHQLKEQTAQLVQLVGKTSGKTGNIRCIGHYLEQRLAAGIGIFLQTCHSRITDTAVRNIDNTQQAQAVMRIIKQAQICQRILDFLALIELRTADHRIGDTALNQHFLEYTRLRVSAVQHCHIAQLSTFIQLQLLHIFNHIACFISFIVRLIVNDFRTVAVGSPQIFRLASAVVVDNGIGSVQNNLRAAVVLLQFHQLGIGVILFKIKDILDIGTAPAINTLVGIAYYADVSVACGQQLRQQILRMVGILIFVNHQIIKLALVFFSYSRIFLQQTQSQQQ